MNFDMSRRDFRNISNNITVHATNVNMTSAQNCDSNNLELTAAQCKRFTMAEWL